MPHPSPTRPLLAPALGLLALAGCGNKSPPTPLPDPPPAVSVDPRCEGTSSAHRETLVRGRVTDLTASGLTAVFHGDSIDHFDDGSSAVVLQVEVFGEPWWPDARDQAFHAFGEHCVRLVEVSAAQLVVEVALQPDHVYDAHRCKPSCCTTVEQQRPAPDGTVECCFCDDRPRR